MKTRVFYYNILVLLCCIFQSFALIGQKDSIKVSEVKIEGLKKTKASYLFRFIDTEKGEIFNEATLLHDVQNLRNLYAVADAKSEIKETEEGLRVTFHIEEALTLFPILSFGSVQENLWWQVGFTDINWWGKGSQLSAYYLNNDRRHNASVYYRVPYIGNSKWGASASFLRWATIEPTYFDVGAVIYDYDFTSYGLSGIYEIQRNHSIELGANYFIENYSKRDEQPLDNPPGPDELSLPKMLFSSNHRISRINYHFYLLDGWDNNIQTESVNNLEAGDWFHVFKNDFRYFKRVGDYGNFALRARIGISTNINTPFAPFVLDSQVNIRGAGNRRDRGTGAAVLNLEFRQSIFDRERKYLREENYSKTGNFAVQVVGFTDVGTWRTPGGQLNELVSDETLRFFAGGGLRFIYKKAYNAVLRIDYGIDIFDAKQRGWVLGAGQYF